MNYYQMSKDELIARNIELENKLASFEKQENERNNAIPDTPNGNQILNECVKSIQNLGLLIADKNHIYVYAAISPEMEKLTGYIQKDLIGRKIEDVFPEEVANDKVTVVDNIFKTGLQAIRQFQLPSPKGEKVWLEFADFPMRDKNGDVAFVVSTVRDIADQKRIELNLKNLPDISNKIIDHNPYSIIVFDKDGYYVRHNDACAKMTGLAETGMEPPHDYNLFEDEVAKQNGFIDELRALRDGKDFRLEKVIYFNYRQLDPEHPEWFTEKIGYSNLTVFPVTNEKGENDFFVAMHKEITEQKLAELEAKKAEQKYRSLVENAPLGIATFGKDGQLVDYNASLLEIFSIDDPNVLNSFNILDESNLNNTKISEYFKSCFENGENTVQEELVSLGKGQSIFIRYHFTPTWNQENEINGVQALIEDVTDLKKTQEEKENLNKMLLQAQKMETIGTLAGGIAHDFNNILTNILWSGELLQQEIKDHGLDLDSVERIISGALRARDVVSQILTFSRQGKQERQPIHLHPVVKEATNFLRNTSPKSVEIRQNIDQHTNLVLADATQIYQIIMNLGTNAIHSFNGKPGLIEIQLTGDISDEEINDSGIAHAGSRVVRLSVKDNGCGIDDKTMERIFDPFFTTKEQSEGTGLGLSVVHGIVEGHDGRIIVESRPGQGSLFKIYLPVFSGKPFEEFPSDGSIPRGTEHILMVDDEQVILDTGKELLEKLGYKVTTVNMPIDALKIFKKQHEEYDLLITDQMMPKMTGMELIQKCKSIRPDIKSIVMTGYSHLFKSTQEIESAKIRVVAKPINLKHLVKAIKELMS